MIKKHRWGLEWGAGGVKLVQVAHQKGAWKNIQSALLEWPLVGNAYPIAVDPLSRVPDIRSGLKSKKWGHLSVSLCIPRYEMFMRWKETAAVDSPGKIMKWAQQEFPLTLDKLYWGAQTMTFQNGRHCTVLGGIPKTRLDRIIDTLGQAGITVKSVGVNFISQMASLASIMPELKTYAILDFGQSHIQFSLVKDGLPFYSRSFYRGSDGWIEKIRETLHSEGKDALSVIVIGGEIQSNSLKKITDKEVLRIPPEINLFMGAAGQAALEDKADVLWLIPPAGKVSFKQKMKTPKDKRVIAAAGLLLLLSQMVVGRWSDAGQQQVKALERQLKDRQSASSVVATVSDHRGADSLFSTVNSVPSRLWLSEVTYEEATKKILLRGRAGSFDGVSQWVGKLSNSGKFRSVISGRTKRLSPSAVEFQVEAFL